MKRTEKYSRHFFNIRIVEGFGMAWLQHLNEYKSGQLENSFKVTQAQDLIQNADCLFIDVSRSSTRLVRVTVKLYPNDLCVGAAICVFMKLFKWDHEKKDYVKHTQLSMELREFKDFCDSISTIGKMIDSKLNETVSSDEGH